MTASAREKALEATLEATTSDRRGVWRRVRMSRGWAFAAPALLYAILTLPFPWEGLAVGDALVKPSVDALLLFALAVGFAPVGRTRGFLSACLVFGTIFTILYRFGATFMPRFWGKPFEPYVDILGLDAIPHLLLHDRPLALQIVSLVGLALAVFGMVYLLMRLWRRTLDGLARTRLRIPLFVILQLFVLIALVAADRSKERRASLLRPSMFGAAVEHVASVMSRGSFRIGRIVDERVAKVEARLEGVPRSFAGLRGACVYVLFLESYGRNIISWPEHREAFDAQLRAREEAIRAAGWGCRSSWIRPSVSGGGSAFAHLEFLTGIEVENRRIFDEVLARDVASLSAMMRACGYLTVNIEPAMPREWPEAEVLGFDRELFRSFFPYEGHPYHWGDMPDQYALAYAQREVLGPSEKPVFGHFVSVSGHAPWSKLPPVVESWSEAARAESFAGEPARTYPINFGNYLKHPEVHAAYLASMQYSLRVAVDFALQQERPSLVIILGDHQAPLGLERASPEQRLDVPIHVLSNKSSLLRAMDDWNYTPGMVPSPKGISRPAADFLPAFVRTFAHRRG